MKGDKKMKIIKHPAVKGKFHIIPSCCAEHSSGDGKPFKKVNWLFLWWMICLDA